MLGQNKKEKLPEVLASEARLWLPGSLIMELMEELNIKETDLKMLWGLWMGLYYPVVQGQSDTERG